MAVFWPLPHTFPLGSSPVLLDYISKHSSKLAILFKNVQCPHCPQPKIPTPYPAICAPLWSGCTPLSQTSPSLYPLPPQVAHCKTLLLKEAMHFHSDTSFLFHWYSDQLLWIALPKTLLFPWNAFLSSISKICLSPLKCCHLQEVFPIHRHWKCVVGAPSPTTYIMSCIH